MDKCCLTCKHWQRVGDLSGLELVGTCRAIQPKQCVPPALPVDRYAEPLFPVTQSTATCSAWAPDHRVDIAQKFFVSPQLVRDGDMEATGTTEWIADDALLSKQVATPRSGQCLRVAYDASHTTGTAKQNFALYHPMKSSTILINGWMRGDGTALPIVKLQNPKGDYVAMVNGTASATWQAFSLRYFWPHYSDDLDQDGIFCWLLLYSDTLNTGLKVEFDDISILQVMARKPEISCWECKHFQHRVINQLVSRMGECRSLTPLSMDPHSAYEPIFAGTIDAPACWCSAWQRSTKAIPAIPDVPTVWPYHESSPPPIYPYSPA